MAVIPGAHGDDVSEFQSVDWDQYVKVRDFGIIRVAYGAHHDDHQWAQNHPARDGRLKACGIYGYLDAFEDPADQAREWVRLVGQLAPHEFFALDHEEGDGDQTGRAQSALAVLDAELHKTTWFYSYVPFIQAHIVLSALGPRPRWLAAYGSEPALAWDLFQHTNGEAGNHECQPAYPGGPVGDCSVIPGGIPRLLELIGSNPQPAPTPPPIPAILQTGDPEVPTKQPLQITTDSNGNGDNVINVPFAKALGVTANGSDPESNHGYSPIPRLSYSDFNGKTKVELEQGVPNAVHLVWVAVGA